MGRAAEIVVVEPEAAPCLIESARAGRLIRGWAPASNMGRPDCKDASLLAYEALRRVADIFIAISDHAAAEAVDLLAAGGATTPSGAAGCAATPALPFDPGAPCMIIASEGPESA